MYDVLILGFRLFLVNFTSHFTDGCAKVDDAEILYWNITAEDGVIHMIDKILSAEDLIPEELYTTTEMELITTTELEISTLEEILSTTEAGIPTTLEIETKAPHVEYTTFAPEVTSKRIEETTVVSTPAIISTEGTTISEMVPTSTSVTEEVTREEVVTTEIGTTTAEIPVSTTGTVSPRVPVELTTSIYTAPEIVTETTESAVTTEIPYETTELPTTTIPTGRALEPTSTQVPVVYLPEEIPPFATPRPAINITTNIPAGPTLMDALKQLNLTTFSNMLNYSGINDTIPLNVPLTIFAPTDSAFNKLDVATIDKLLSDRERLREILRYHCVPSSIPGEALPKAVQATTLQGGPVFFTVYTIKGVSNKTFFLRLHPVFLWSSFSTRITCSKCKIRY